MDKHKKTILELFKQTSFPENQKNSVHNLLKNKKIILYGSGDGFFTFSVFIVKRYKLAVSAVFDRKFKSGDNFYGLPAFSPFRYKPTCEEKENALVVITVGKKEYHKKIFSCLNNLGFKNILLATDIYEYHIPSMPEELEKKGFDYYLDNKEKIIESLEFFSDDLSKKVYTSFLQIHMQRKPKKISACPLEEQYFPKDIILNKGYSRFINCGAYDGDTIKRLNVLMGKVETVVCFEPDARNFKLLADYLRLNYNKIAENIIAFPCGVFDRTKKFRFDSSNRINSSILGSGKDIIQCVSLDEAMPAFKPTFITMDVEGVELEALKGAEKLIKENAPDLAISVYHTPNHVWDIPLYLKSLKRDYNFYLRNYTSFPSETVLYATV